MTSRQRLLTALHAGTPGRRPATTHRVMSRFLDGCLGGISAREFFRGAYAARPPRAAARRVVL